MRKPVFRISDLMSDTNQAIQPQKMARRLKFRDLQSRWIGTDQLHGNLHDYHAAGLRFGWRKI